MPSTLAAAVRNHYRKDKEHHSLAELRPKEIILRKTSEAEDLLTATNLITGEIVNYADFQKIKKREEYIKLETLKNQLSIEDFDKKVELGSWHLLNLISSV